MARKKKTNTPKNNFYWIYASIIFLIISLSFVGGDKGLQNVQQTDISSFEVMRMGKFMDGRRMSITKRMSS